MERSFYRSTKTYWVHHCQWWTRVVVYWALPAASSCPCCWWASSASPARWSPRSWRQKWQGPPEWPVSLTGCSGERTHSFHSSAALFAWSCAEGISACPSSGKNCCSCSLVHIDFRYSSCTCSSFEICGSVGCLLKAACQAHYSSQWCYFWAWLSTWADSYSDS